MIELETSVQVQIFWQSPGCTTPATLEGGANKESSAVLEGLFFFLQISICQRNYTELSK